jgi:hypothetical protein
MQAVHLALFVLGLWPLSRAWLATRRTALFHAVLWGHAAWLAWGVTLVSSVGIHPDPAVYVALCLTACAGVAVFGARRPQVTAWNFVVLGLFAVMVLPLVETWLIGARSLDWLRITFLAVTLAVAVLNYLPTRIGPAAFLLGLGCAAELVAVAAPTPLPLGPEADAVRLCVLAAPLAAWLTVRLLPRDEPSELDRTWRDFRDRWGVVWAQRVREQFSRSAANAGWPVTLSWQGFVFRGETNHPMQHEVAATLQALLKRFLD